MLVAVKVPVSTPLVAVSGVVTKSTMTPVATADEAGAWIWSPVGALAIPCQVTVYDTVPPLRVKSAAPLAVLLFGVGRSFAPFICAKTADAATVTLPFIPP